MRPPPPVLQQDKKPSPYRVKTIVYINNSYVSAVEGYAKGGRSRGSVQYIAFTVILRSIHFCVW